MVSFERASGVLVPARVFNMLVDLALALVDLAIETNRVDHPPTQ